MDDITNEPTTGDQHRAKRERILAVSRTVHSIPTEEGGMLKRPAAPRPTAPSSGNERFWRRAAITAGGMAALASGLAAGLLLRRR